MHTHTHSLTQTHLHITATYGGNDEVADDNVVDVLHYEHVVQSDTRSWSWSCSWHIQLHSGILFHPGTPQSALRALLSLHSPCRFSALSPYPSRRSSLCLAKSEKYVWGRNDVFLVNCRFWPGTRLPPRPQLPWRTTLYPSIIQFIGSNMCVCHSISPQRCSEACLTNSNPEILVLSLSLSSMLLPRLADEVLFWVSNMHSEKRGCNKWGRTLLFILIADSRQARYHQL